MRDNVRFAAAAQSGGFPVLQVWRTDELGRGAWLWVRTPADFCSLTDEEWREIRRMANWAVETAPAEILAPAAKNDAPAT